MYNTLSEYAKFSQVVVDSTGAPSATDIESTPVSMDGFDSATFVTRVNVIPAITTGLLWVHPMVGASSASMVDASSSDAYCAYTTALSSTDDGNLLILDIVKPHHKWVGVHIQKDSTNGLNTDCLAIQYSGKKRPITQPTAFVIDETVNLTPTTS